MTLREVMTTAGSSIGQVIGSTALNPQCMEENVVPLGAHNGYDVYELDCFDYVLIHISGSTHLVLATELDDDTDEARAAAMAIRQGKSSAMEPESDMESARR